MNDDQASDVDAGITALRLLLIALHAMEGTGTGPVTLPFTITTTSQAVLHQLLGITLSAMLGNASYADGVQNEEDERRWVRDWLRLEIDTATLNALGGELTSWLEENLGGPDELSG
jgi:hypothetical protein